MEEAGDGACAEELEFRAIFEQTAARGQLLDDLLELQAWLSQRSVEVADGVSTGSLPSELQLDAGELSARLDAVDAALGELDSEHARHLLLMQSSER